MFDIGWMELLLIGIVALIVVGPKELPGLFRTVGNFMGRARGMAREFQRSMEQAANESGLKEATKDLNEAAKGLNSINKLNLNSATSSAKKYATDVAKQVAEQDPVGEAPEPEKFAVPAVPASSAATTVPEAPVADKDTPKTGDGAESDRP